MRVMKRSTPLATALLITLMILLDSHAAKAGTTGVLSGHIFSDLGFPLGGATVEIVGVRDFRLSNRQLDFQRGVLDTRITDGNGFFVFLSVEPGLYAIRPLLQGWNYNCLPRVVVVADQTSFIDLAMTQPQEQINCGPQVYYGPF